MALIFRVVMNRIKIILEERGIKQIWLAEQLGKSYNMVNAYVQNRRQPSLEVLNSIANILNMDVKELVTSNKDK
jgi:transcriptional regulator with XRE-family HTH domain